MGIFGWDLPPGCSIRDIERQAGPDPSPESEEVYEILDNAEVNQTVIDKVCAIVDRLALKECPVCIQKQNEAETKAQAEYDQMMKETNGMGYLSMSDESDGK